MSLFGGSSTPAFGSASPFGGASSTPAFGQQPSTPAFGQPATPAVPSFGSFGSSTPAFGATPSTPAFGATPTNNAFGAPPSTPAFGSATPNAFGSTTPSAFGSAAPTPSAFGAPSTSAFGAASGSAFGSATPSAFGAASTSAFGSGTPSAFGAASTSAFGAPTPSTGFGAFGSAASTSAFGGGFSSSSLFNPQPQVNNTWNTQPAAQPAELKPETKVRDLPQPLQEQLFACEKFLQQQRLASAKLRNVSHQMDTNTMKTNQLTEKYFVNLKRSLANLGVFQKHLDSLRSVLLDERRNYDGIFSALATYFSGNNNNNSTNGNGNMNGNMNINMNGNTSNQYGQSRIPAAYFDNVVNDMEKRANEYRKEIEELSDFLTSNNTTANIMSTNYNGNMQANGGNNSNSGNKAGLEVVIQRQYKYFMHVASQIARLHDEITRLVEFFREFRAKRMPLADDPFQLADSQDRAKSQRLRLLAEKRMLEAARKSAAQQNNQNTTTNNNNNTGFAAQSTPGLFGNAGAPAPSTGLFGGAQSAPSLFGNTGAAAATPSTGLFGSATPAASSGGLFGATPAPAQSGGLFGSATPAGSFGGGAASAGGLFGGGAAASGGAFGAPTNASTPSLFGGGSNGAFDSQPGTRRRKR